MRTQAIKGQAERSTRIATLLQEMESTADSSYAHFCGVRTKCTTQPESVLGIRMPVLRRTIRELTRAGITASEADALLLPLAKTTYEYKLLYGGVAAQVYPIEHITQLLSTLMDLTDGWATCDFYTEVVDRLAQHDPDTVLQCLHTAEVSPNPYARRLAIVSCIRLYKSGIVDISHILALVERHQISDEYYIQMGIAWLLAEMYVHETPTVHLFMTERLESTPIHRMLIRKLKDSFRVDDY